MPLRHKSSIVLPLNVMPSCCQQHESFSLHAVNYIARVSNITEHDIETSSLLVIYNSCSKLTGNEFAFRVSSKTNKGSPLDVTHSAEKTRRVGLRPTSTESTARE